MFGHKWIYHSKKDGKNGKKECISFFGFRRCSGCGIVEESINQYFDETQHVVICEWVRVDEAKLVASKI
jgi:hypothetical protein